MAILVDNDTKLVVQGLTGREGRFHALRNKAYGTDLVAGVTPGKGGTDVEGVPIFDTVAEAVTETGANTSMVFVPPPFAADAILEAYDAGIETIITITEGIPAMDMARAVGYIRAARTQRDRGDAHRAELPRRHLPRTRPTSASSRPRSARQGPIGLVSRSGTLVYQIVHELSQKRPRPVDVRRHRRRSDPGKRFHRRADRCSTRTIETELVVMVGEIGGDAEERAAAWIKDNMTKPVVAYIAGFTAPEGKRMGHAGAIISGSKGTAQAKADALEAAGVRVGRNPTEVADLVVEARKA